MNKKDKELNTLAPSLYDFMEDDTHIGINPSTFTIKDFKKAITGMWMNTSQIEYRKLLRSLEMSMTEKEYNIFRAFKRC